MRLSNTSFFVVNHRPEQFLEGDDLAGVKFLSHAQLSSSPLRQSAAAWRNQSLQPATYLLLIAKVFLSKLSFKVPLFPFNNASLHYDDSRYNHEKHPDRVNK